MKPLDVVRTYGIFLMETAQKDQMIKQNLPMYTITTTLGSEIRKFTAVNSSLSAGIPVLVKLLCLMESCNVYNHSHRKSFFVFTNISALRIFCLSRAVLSLTSEISAEKSSAAHRRTVSNVPNVLAAILLQNIGTRLELQVTIGAWDTPHFIDHRKSVAHRH